MVDLALVLGIDPGQPLANRVIDRSDRAGHALAKIAPLVAVAQLHRLVRSGRCARWHRRAAEAAIFEQDIDLDRGVAPAVENFAGVDVDDRGHGGNSCSC